MSRQSSEHIGRMLRGPKSVIMHSEEELIDGLRKVRLRDMGIPVPPVYPYKDAELCLTNDVHIQELYPPQRYVLSTELQKISNLQRKVLAWSDGAVDILRLNGFARLTFKDGFVQDILPPIIERNIPVTGFERTVDDLLVCDGMHRLYYAWLTQQYPAWVVKVEGVGVPYYAHTLAWSLGEIDLLDDSANPGCVPEGYIKKFHRFLDYKAYYRDFNTAFNNIGDSRPVVKRSDTSDVRMLGEVPM
jgi:hypothetical protein